LDSQVIVDPTGPGLESTGGCRARFSPASHGAGPVGRDVFNGHRSIFFVQQRVPGRLISKIDLNRCGGLFLSLRLQVLTALVIDINVFIILLTISINAIY
jgi:hypothetical protein